MRKWLIVLMILAVGGCSSAESAEETVAASGEGCADVIEATITADGNAWVIAATVSSSDTGWEKYADVWQVWGPDNEVLAERVLAHPHETEQPFTRSLSGIEIPAEVDSVSIAARDSVVGFCGEVFTLEVPTR